MRAPPVRRPATAGDAPRPAAGAPGPEVLAGGNAAVARLVRRYAAESDAGSGAGMAGSGGGSGAGVAGSGAGVAGSGADVAARLDAGSGRGHPLPEPVRHDLENGTGASLEAVRIHNDGAADGLARDLSARALTTGPDIYFRAGAYNPGSADGYRLLAHEVAHTVQQQSGPVSAEAQHGLAVSRPGDPDERAAEAAAAALTRNRGDTGGSSALAGDRAAATNPTYRATGRTVQRFSGFEHESLGDATKAVIDLGGGLVLNWGQVVAIAGDEIGTVEELQALAGSTDGRRQIRAALEHAELVQPITSALPAATKDERDKQVSTYVKLAMANVSHFAAGGDALKTWHGHHDRALQAALGAGLSGDQAEFERAQLIEAFGQHFLTDMFSGGHIRTPRAEILDFYLAHAKAMSEAFVKNLRERAENYLVAQVMMQVGVGVGPPSMQAPPIPGFPSVRGSAAQDKAREKVRAAIDAELPAALAKIGGMDGLAEQFGRALAGAVSGAIHDREGRQGVVVASEDHPEPWRAMGDSQLDEKIPGPLVADPSISREQAEKAVIAAREQLFAARAAGERETVITRVAPPDPPTGLIVHFGFDSAALDGSGAGVEAAGAYLHTHPDRQVVLTGHTDPTGADDYNLALGRRRAESVQAALIAGGARPEQTATVTRGEGEPLTTDPGRFGQNRRVEFLWQDRSVFPDPAVTTMCVDPIRERAQQAIAGFGPPYPAVERFIPYEMPFQNDFLPEWRWGKLPPEMIAEIDRWVRANVGGPLKDLVAAVPETMMAEGYTFTIRVLVEQIASELMAAPAQTLGRLIGQPP